MNLSSFDIKPHYLGRIGVLRQKYHTDINNLFLGSLACIAKDEMVF